MSEKFSLLGIEEGLLYTIFSSIGTEHHLAMCLQTTKKFTSLAQRFKDERRILVQNMFRGLKERLDNLMLEDGYSVLVNTSSRITFSSSAKTGGAARRFRPTCSLSSTSSM